MAEHPPRIGTWRFVTNDGRAVVHHVGHTADEALRRALPELRLLLEREPTWNDLEEPHLVEEDCLAAFVDKVAAEWDIDPADVLVLGRRTRP